MYENMSGWRLNVDGVNAHAEGGRVMVRRPREHTQKTKEVHTRQLRLRSATPALNAGGRSMTQELGLSIPPT